MDCSSNLRVFIEAKLWEPSDPARGYVRRSSLVRALLIRASKRMTIRKTNKNLQNILGESDCYKQFQGFKKLNYKASVSPSAYASQRKTFYGKRCQNIFVEIAMSNLRALNYPRQAAGPESSSANSYMPQKKNKSFRVKFWKYITINPRKKKQTFPGKIYCHKY